MRTLELDQARKLHLAAQGLLQRPAGPATPAALRRCIARMGLLQIDTIHVVARSPYLVLFSRLGDYAPAWLDQALERGHLFETWAHEACFAPVQDVALHRSYNGSTRRHWGLSSAKESHVGQRANLDRLLAHIKERGPVKSADFERTDDRRGGGWWGWKDEKLWLEALFARGELMVARRDKFQRIYDLAHRVCPQIEGMELPDATTVQQTFTERAVAALGITQARWVHDYFRTKPRLKDADLQALVAAGRLEQVQVEQWAAPAYVHRSNLRLLRLAQQGRLEASNSTLLSPFDPVVWDRERASVMFNFDYRIECYTPQHKRVHGYFVLPVLHQGELVARLDAKAHRSQGIFEVKALYLEPTAKADADLIRGLALAIRQCAQWHEAPKVQLVWTAPQRLAAALRRALRETN